MRVRTDPCSGLLLVFVGWSLLILAEVPMAAVLRQAWLGPAVGCLRVVPRRPFLRSLWWQFPGNLGPGLLLAFVGWYLANHG